MNSHLDFVKASLLFKKREKEASGRQVSAYELKNCYLGIDVDNKTILQVFQEHNDKVKGLENIDYAPLTVQRYFTAFMHVKDFIKLKYKREDLPLTDITPMFISDFEYYMKTTRKCCHNTAVKYIKNFKTIVRIALANGWMKTDPFSNIKYHYDEVDLDFLTEKELETLIKKEFVIERLQQVKEVYLFCPI